MKLSHYDMKWSISDPLGRPGCPTDQYLSLIKKKTVVLQSPCGSDFAPKLALKTLASTTLTQKHTRTELLDVTAMESYRAECIGLYCKNK